MVESGYYPPGAEYDSKAPYNQPDISKKEIEVLVSVTLSKSVKIKVDDYTITDEGVDEDGYPYENIDFSSCDLKSAVENQILLPHEVGQLLVDIDNNPHKIPPKSEFMKEDLCGWNVDDFEVIIE